MFSGVNETTNNPSIYWKKYDSNMEIIHAFFKAHYQLYTSHNQL